MDAPRGFLKSLGFLGRGDGDAVVAPVAGTIQDRKAKRHDMTGAKMNLLVDANLYILHLKDLSALGLCGLTDAPLAPEQTVILYVTPHDTVPLHIRWIRRTLIGASFFERLSDETMQRLLRLHGRNRKQH
jgi:hypothetical protein